VGHSYGNVKGAANPDFAWNSDYQYCCALAGTPQGNIAMNYVARFAMVFIAGLPVSVAQSMIASAQVDASHQLEAFTKTAFYGQLLNRALATLPDSVFKRCPTFVSSGSQVSQFHLDQTGSQTPDFGCNDFL
jgi:hypothetical protein